MKPAEEIRAAETIKPTTISMIFCLNPRHAMKKMLKIGGIVCVMIPVLLAGCKKDIGENADTLPTYTVADTDEVEFASFFLGNPATKTVYSGVVADDKSERIDWVAGDKITVWSDFSRTAAGKHNADFTVNTVVLENGRSIGKITTDTPLKWTASHKEDYTFWGVYPAGTVDFENNSFNAEIPAAQTLVTNATNQKREADMKNAYMVSYNKVPYFTKPVRINFEPLFTAFEVTVKSKDETSFHLNSITLASDSTALAGTFAVSCAEDGTWTADCSQATGKSVTAVFSDKPEVTKNNPLTFTILALPQDLTDLSLTFNIDDNINRVLKLSKGGVPYVYAGNKKHRISISIPGDWKFDEITLDLQVIDWTEQDLTEDGDVYTQATQFEIDGAENKMEALNAEVDASTTMTAEEKAAAKKDNEAYEQTWRVTPGQAFTISYKIFLPVGASWAIVPQGDTGDFTVTGTTTGTVAEGGTRVTLTVVSNATTKKELYFKTTVTEGSTTYSLDSETQLYDMRGYHKFIVNDN